MEKKLYRNTHEGALSGVCAGLGEYWQVDKTWIRLAFVLSVVFSSFFGFGLLGAVVYIVLWVVIPPKPFTSNADRQASFYDVDYRVQDDYRTGADYSDSGYGASGYDDSGYDHYETDYKVSEDMYYTGPEYATDAPKPAHTTKRDRTVAGVILLSVGLFFLLYQLNVFYWVDLIRYWPVLLIISGIAVIYRSFGGTPESRSKEAAAGDSSSKQSASTDSFTTNAEEL